MSSTILRTLRTPTLFLFLGIATSNFLGENVYSITSINGASMTPTLSPSQHLTGRKDYLLWSKMSPSRHLRRGDIVQFRSPQNPEGFSVKRVIGLEGDEVILDGRRRPERTRDGSDVGATRAWESWGGRVKVPEGHVWVEGDNWRKSNDSNWYGPISKSLITGRAVAICWPWERFGLQPWDGFEVKTRVRKGVVDNRSDMQVLAKLESE